MQVEILNCRQATANARMMMMIVFISTPKLRQYEVRYGASHVFQHHVFLTFKKNLSYIGAPYEVILDGREHPILKRTQNMRQR